MTTQLGVFFIIGYLVGGDLGRIAFYMLRLRRMS